MSDDELELREFLGTTSFGGKRVEADLDAAYARTKRQVPSNDIDSAPASPPPRGDQETSAEDSMEDSSDDEEGLPTTHEIVLEKHSRAISGLSLDPSGSRIVSGSHDCQVALWDFSGMGHMHRAFKVIEPFESVQIRSTEFNASGEVLLVTAAGWQPKLFSREGEEMAELPRGDPYLRDMKNTKGHVGEVTSGSWNPKMKSQFMTSSADATVRLWETNNPSKCLQVLAYKSKQAGAGKVRCSRVGYSTDGKIISSAYADGSLCLWATDGPYHRPMGGLVTSAHDLDDQITGLSLSQDGWSFVSRGMTTIKLWDRRKFKDPISIVGDLPTAFEDTDIIFSPNNQELLTPSNSGSAACIQVLSSKTLKCIEKISLPSPAIKVVYHPKINQIITGQASGNIHVLYSPERSTRGAKLVVSRAPKARHVDDLLTADIDESAGEVRSEDASNLSGNRARNAARKDPKLSNMPELPSTQRRAERKVVGDVVHFRDQDPQKELLKYDEAAKKDPVFFGVYNKNQPVTQFAELEEAEPEETPANKRFKFTPRDSK